jgi:ELWxxDGT repeat protein
MKSILLSVATLISINVLAQLKTVYSITPSKNISCANPALINNNFFFAGNDPSISGLGSELFISDSSEVGTTLVQNIHSTPFNGSSPEAFTKLNNTQVVFWAQDATNGKELWVTDGASSGTNLVKDISPGSSSSAYNYFHNVGNEVYFMTNDGTNGYELWKTDGTTSGTNMIKNINPTGDGMNLPSTVYQFDYYGKAIANIGNTIYFVATDGTTGYELWKTDGTSSGTSLVKDIYTGSNSSKPSNFVVINNTLYFCATTNAEGRELWKSDGTNSGTVLVKDLSPLFAANSNPNYLISLNNKIYFAGISNSQATLFESDGSSVGTYSVFTSANYSTTFSRLTKVDTSIYFFESNTGSPATYNLHKFNGVTNNAILIKSNMYGASGAPYQPTKEKSVALDGMLYFTFDDGVNGDELWQSDGTLTGTKMITDIGLGSQTSWIDYLIPVSNGNNSRLYFTSTKKTGLLYIKADAVITKTNKYEKEVDFIIYPNPANEVINIKIKNEFNGSKITLNNILGEKVLEDEMTTNQLQINTNYLKSGVYLITIQNNNSQSTKKIIIE